MTSNETWFVRVFQRGNLAVLLLILHLCQGAVFQPSKYNDSAISYSKMRTSLLYPPPLTQQGEDTEPRLEPLQECPTDACDCAINININQPFIDCKYKQLQEIPTFKSINKVYHEIDFSVGNYIKHVPDNAFVNLRVKNINMLGNYLDVNIGSSAFKGLELHLEGLKIQGNGVNPIPYDKMVNLTNLKVLHVESFSQRSAAENAYFQHFPDLEQLTLAEINMLTVDENTFQGKLQKLHYLELRNVYITEIPVAHLQHLTGLQSLHIKQNNRIKTVAGKSFEQLIGLQELKITGNPNLEQIESDAFSVVSLSLKTLDLSSNRLNLASLKSLSSQRWPTLQHLTLNYNPNFDIAQFNESVFRNMGKLQYLFIKGVQLKTITSDLFSGLESLQGVDLGFNELEEVADGAFSHSKDLVEILLNYQFYVTTGPHPVTSISPTAFTGLEKVLLRLNLEQTEVKPEQLWQILERLTQLKELLLTQTGLNEIPNYAFRKTTGLRVLNLDNNGLTTLPVNAFRGLEEFLEELSLVQNDISELNECMFKNFTRLRTIKLEKNPLSCDCKLVWLYRHIQTADEYEKKSYICATPEQFANHPLYNISENKLCSNYQPQPCSPNTETTPQTTRQPSTLKPGYNLQMTTTKNSVILSWTVADRSSITGYKIIYVKTTTGVRNEVILHRDTTFYTIIDLSPGTFYNICVVPEIDSSWNNAAGECKMAQTQGDTSSSNNNQNSNNSNNNNSNIITGVVIAAVVVVILVGFGVYLVVKYKYKVERLQQLPFTITNTRGQLACGEGMVVATLPNDYITMKNLQQQQYMHSPQTLHRQYGIDGEENPYHPYYSIRPKRRNPYENDDEGTEDGTTEDEGVGLGNSEEILFKPDLNERHSAQSRLHVIDLVKTDRERNSRPLPATPDKSDNEKALDRSLTTQTKQNRKNAAKDKTPDTSLEDITSMNDDKTKIINKKKMLKKENTKKETDKEERHSE